MAERAQFDYWVGRKNELQDLRAAIQKGESRLVWGPTDAGKTALIKKVISELPDEDRRKCVYWEGPASRRQLVAHFIERLYKIGDPFVRKKVHIDGATEGPYSSVTGITMPIPVPVINMNNDEYRCGVVVVMVESEKIPVGSRSVPISG